MNVISSTINLQSFRTARFIFSACERKIVWLSNYPFVNQPRTNRNEMQHQVHIKLMWRSLYHFCLIFLLSSLCCIIWPVVVHSPSQAVSVKRVVGQPLDFGSRIKDTLPSPLSPRNFHFTRNLLFSSNRFSIHTYVSCNTENILFSVLFRDSLHYNCNCSLANLIIPSFETELNLLARSLGDRTFEYQLSLPDCCCPFVPSIVVVLSASGQ